ncbi:MULTISPECIES: ABC transporter permease [Comamonas]|uniref:ABC transporter permease n=1 Tax=Comamonas avium TaxID=2762231 RepID=A0ABR8SEP7_9BURK|nr:MULTISPECIES: ABC transporter permease [Comamonas]MBD7961589.1 ABC transporter permease [Comamonas avium]
MPPFIASLQREWQRLRACRWDWAMVSWVPLLSMALMCWIFSAGQPYKLPIAVWNEDHSSMSRQLVRMLQATPGLEVVHSVLNPAEAADALQRMQVYGVVHIPPGMERDVKRGGAATVTLMHNAQLATASSLLQRDLQQVVGTLSAGAEMQARAKRGDPHQALQVRMEPITTKLVALFNVSTNYEQFLAATLVPALVHILAMTAGVWCVGRELRDRSLGAWLQASSSGLDTLAALLGKLAIPAALLWGSGMLCLLYLAQLRGWHVAGSMGWIAVGLAALVGVSLAAGAVLAAVTLSLRTALSGAGLLSAPAFAFSGVGFPLLSMSASARGWALAMPYTHYARLQMEQWQMGAPVAQTVPVVGGLLLATLVLLALATWGLQRARTLPERWGGR